MKKHPRLILYLILHALLLAYSVSCVFSKLAAAEPFGSIRFFLYYGLDLLLLAVFALGWQQILKRMPLTSAYANKAVTVIWGVFWGILLFRESLSVRQLFGVALVIGGVLLFGLSEKGDADGK